MDLATLPVYTSHKRVRAARIGMIERDTDSPHNIKALHLSVPAIVGGDTVLEEFDPRTVNGLFSRYEPVEGDYLVRYEDGHVSISPKQAFEEGYTLEPEGRAAPLASPHGHASTLDEAMATGQHQPGRA